MVKEELVLDGLAWAGVSEKARVARISSGLVRELGRYLTVHTQTRIKQAIRVTLPPHGRGKAIFEAVSKEYLRQAVIFRARKEAHDNWAAWQEKEAKLDTRLNRAYACRFARPIYATRCSWVGQWDDPERTEFNKRETARDIGDNCIALTHWNDHAVALVTSTGDIERHHIAVRQWGMITRTYLRHNRSKNLVEAAVSLGGPKVKTALSKGKRVVTDWVDRRSFIHHDGSDHIPVGIEEIPWLAVVNEGGEGWHLKWDRVLIHGDTITPDKTESD
jgi:hypothetical protein